MIWLRQSTAVDVLLGPFVDDTDFKTAEIALTIVQADIRLLKNGGVFAQTNNVAGATHRENGHYLTPLDTTDTNTLGRLRVVVNKAGALQVWQDFMIVSANVWDAMFGADKLQVDTTEWAGAVVNALIAGRVPANAEVVGDKTGYSIGAGGIPSGAHAATELNNIADAHLDRRLDLGVDSGGDTTISRTVRQSLRAMRNRVAIAASTMTVYKEDDVTNSHTLAVTRTAGDPITELNPS